MGLPLWCPSDILFTPYTHREKPISIQTTSATTKSLFYCFLDKKQIVFPNNKNLNKADV